MPGNSSRECQGKKERKKEEKMPAPALFMVVSPTEPCDGQAGGEDSAGD